MVMERDITQRHSMGPALPPEQQQHEDDLIVDTLHRVRVYAALYHGQPIEKRDVLPDLAMLKARFEFIKNLMSDPYGPEEGFDNGTIC
jgi:hypothetical protein